MPDVETLATEFTIVIRELLTPQELREIDKRNAGEIDNSICHSHDFCDANQAMIDALARLNVEIDFCDESQLALIDNAWDLAKSKGFAQGEMQ